MASNFDPFTQDITMHHADGSEFNVPVILVDNFVQYCIRICINYGCQLGASIVLLVVLILLTRPEKRRSAVFWLNTLALVCNIARLFCQVFYFTGEFVRIYPYFAHDYSRATTASYTGSVLGVIFAFLIVVFMEVSLVLQVQVVCATVRRRYKKLLLAASILMAMIPIGFRFALTVVGSIHIMTLKAQDQYQWLESATTIVITISICFFCTIFVVKLGFAIKLRKKLNVREFGPMKVIFVMGCQTMIVPGMSFFPSLLINKYIANINSHLLNPPIRSRSPRTRLQRPNPCHHLPPPLLHLGRRQPRKLQTQPRLAPHLRLPRPPPEPQRHEPVEKQADVVHLLGWHYEY